jgi:hypothetical protein
MFQATNIRIAASAASGTLAASGAATSRIASSVAACTMPATGVDAPLFTLVTVRAIVPVAGMPPKNGAMKLATPCAISSWFGSCRSSIMLSATRAHSSDSIAPSSAIVIVGAINCLTRSHEKSGSANDGSPCGMPPNLVPIVSTGSSNSVTAIVAQPSATIVAGTCAIQRFHGTWPIW